MHRAWTAGAWSRTDENERCPTCGIDKRYPTALHIVDCRTDENGDQE